MAAIPSLYASRFLDAQSEIRKCHELLPSGSMASIREGMARVRDHISFLEKESPTAPACMQDLELLRDDLSCLTIRANIAARKHWGLTNSTVEILNKTDIDQASFERLLASLTCDLADTRFFVVEPSHSWGKKRYALATFEQITAPGCRKGEEWLPTHNHTTTLANIITTNELGLNPQQVDRLVRKLIAVKADFSTVDYTAFPGMGTKLSMQNNPLKSLIALGSQNTDYDETIVQLIQYILRDVSVPSIILNHIDHYPYSMTYLTLLIRQGKEDIALVLLNNSGMLDQIIDEDDLIMACNSFGTTAVERPKGIAFVPVLIRKLLAQNQMISKATIQTCMAALKSATPQKVEKEKERLRKGNWLQEWANQAPADESYMCKTIRSTLQMNFPSFQSLCKQALRDAAISERILHAYAEHLVLQNGLGGNLSDDYRTNGRVEQRIKYDYMKTPFGQRRLSELLHILEQCLRINSINDTGDVCQLTFQVEKRIADEALT